MEPFTVIILVIVVIVWFACGFLSEDLHRRKGYEGGFWVGFLLGLIGLIYSVGLPDLRAKKVIRNEQGEIFLVPEENEASASEEQGTASDDPEPPSEKQE